jgi:hypothetical protein
VLNVSAPGHFGAPKDFGRALVPVAPPAAAAARYVVSAVGTPALAVVDIDAAGQAASQALNPIVISENAAGPITALAEVPGTSQVILGAAAAAAGRVYLMDVGATPSVTLFKESFAEDRYGLGVAAGKLTGADAPELIVVSGDKLSVFVDGDASATPLQPGAAPPCPISLGTDLDARYRLSRPVVVVGGLIAVGTPSATALGTVSLFSVSGGAVTCAGQIDGIENRFGQALAVGDFNGDGIEDLLVGAPPRNAYLLTGPVSASAAISAITYADSEGEFGGALAAIDVDGQKGDEALISDSAAVVGGMQVAGSVVVYGGPTLANKLMVVTAHDPETGGAYGSAVAALRFCAPPCMPAQEQRLPLVGATERTFTYFLFGPASQDPRRP